LRAIDILKKRALYTTCLCIHRQSVRECSRGKIWNEKNEGNYFWSFWYI